MMINVENLFFNTVIPSHRQMDPDFRRDDEVIGFLVAPSNPRHSGESRNPFRTPNGFKLSSG
jgi:hypothetical protein